MANDQPISEKRVVYGILIVLGSSALVMLTAGLVTPAWIVTEYSDLTDGVPDTKISMGLWYVTYCASGVCKAKELIDFWDNFGPPGMGAAVSHAVTELRVEAILSVGNMIIVMMCLLKIICCSPSGIYNNSKGLWIVMCVSSAISGICALIAAGNHGQNIAKSHSFLNAVAVSPHKFPYSIVVEGVGGVLACLFFIIIVIDTYRAMNRINIANQPQIYAMTTIMSGAQPFASQPYAGQAYNGPPPSLVPYGNQSDYSRYDNPSHSYPDVSEHKQDMPPDYSG